MTNDAAARMPAQPEPIDQPPAEPCSACRSQPGAVNQPPSTSNRETTVALVFGLHMPTFNNPNLSTPELLALAGSVKRMLA